MSHKILEDARLKAAVQTQQHTLEFYMLAFSREPDKQGDRIARDAADIWLRNFYAAGEPLPISFTHSAVADPGNPFNIIGHAPADKAHVFKDDHGIRVVAALDTDSNPTAAQVYSLAKRRVVTGASVFFYMGPDSQRVQKDGSTLITRIDDIIECGPCLDPANEDAYIVAVKSMQTVAKAVDNSAWDGDRAMGMCSSAADFARIAFRRTGDSDPSTAAAWALPHHMGPGMADSPNARGVAAAMGALNGARGGAPSLRDASAARSHLEAHARQIEAARGKAEGWDRVLESLEPHSPVDLTIAKAGRAISAANRARLEAHLAELDAARVGIMELLESSEPITPEANSEEPETANEEESEGPNDWLTKELARNEEILAASSTTQPE